VGQHATVHPRRPAGFDVCLACTEKPLRARRRADRAWSDPVGSAIPVHSWAAVAGSWTVPAGWVRLLGSPVAHQPHPERPGHVMCGLALTGPEPVYRHRPSQMSTCARCVQARRRALSPARRRADRAWSDPEIPTNPAGFAIPAHGTNPVTNRGCDFCQRRTHPRFLTATWLEQSPRPPILTAACPRCYRTASGHVILRQRGISCPPIRRSAVHSPGVTCPPIRRSQCPLTRTGAAKLRPVNDAHRLALRRRLGLPDDGKDNRRRLPKGVKRDAGSQPARVTSVTSAGLPGMGRRA